MHSLKRKKRPLSPPLEARTSNEGLEHSSELSGLAAQPGTLAAPLASGRWRAGGGARAPRRRGTRTGLKYNEGDALVECLVSRDTREVERVERARAHSESLSKAQLRGGQGSHTTHTHARGSASKRHLRTAVIGLRAAHRPLRVEVALDTHAEVERDARAVRRVGGHLVCG